MLRLLSPLSAHGFQNCAPNARLRGKTRVEPPLNSDLGVKQSVHAVKTPVKPAVKRSVRPVKRTQITTIPAPYVAPRYFPAFSSPMAAASPGVTRP